MEARRADLYGHSHAVQGDGEISLTALETRLKELRIQVILHKQKNLAWPVAETDSHWIIIGLDKDLNAAMTLAARNAIKFLATQAKISELDAYALCSVAACCAVVFCRLACALTSADCAASKLFCADCTVACCLV